jgi:heavy metal efflux system protein
MQTYDHGHQMQADSGTRDTGRVLMTAFSACIGLVPAAFSTGIGSQVQRPLATVVVGGMLVGPIMLLIVVPALQLVFLRKSTENYEEMPPELKEV